MLIFRNVQTIDGKRLDYAIPSEQEKHIEASHLTLFPALIDPHVHFRVPGAEHKETWETAAKAALCGGVSTVFDMPNNTPACTTAETLIAKKKIIDAQLHACGLPIRYHLYLGADQRHLQEIPKVNKQIIGLKIYMGSSTGDLLMDQEQALEEAFRIAAHNDVLIAVHAEDEAMLQTQKKQYAGQTDPSFHSKIRRPEAAEKAVHDAIALARKYKARLYIAHVSTQKELKLIRQAKQEGLSVYAEATPHHLFLSTKEYAELGTLALVNPPLRDEIDREALWEAIYEGTIDTIGTDHAPHTLEEKKRPFGLAPSGFPSIEFYFSLLLTAYHQKKLSLKQIVSLTHTRIQEIFRLAPHKDHVLVDLERETTIGNRPFRSKSGWSPYTGWTVKGWPCYTIIEGKLFDLETL